MDRAKLGGMALAKVNRRGLAGNKTWVANGLEATAYLGDLSSLRVKTKMAEMKSDKETLGLCWNEIVPINFLCRLV